MGAGLQQLPPAELDALARVHEAGLRRVHDLQVCLTPLPPCIAQTPGNGQMLDQMIVCLIK